MLVGYARVSTKDQNIDLQIHALRAAGCQKFFTDVGVSGVASSRPGLDQALEHMRADDVLLTWRLDRIGRSTKDVLAFIEELQERGVGFRSLTESFDTTGTMGKVLVTIIAALAEMERALIVERTKAGLEAARARGRVGGRRRVLTAKQDKAIRSLYEARDTSLKDIASNFGVSEPTVWRSLQRTRS